MEQQNKIILNNKIKKLIEHRIRFIPKRLILLGIQVEIKIRKKLRCQEGLSVKGYYHPEKRLIELAESPRMNQTLFHELSHFFNQEFSGGQFDNELKCNTMGKFMFQLMEQLTKHSFKINQKRQKWNKTKNVKKKSAKSSKNLKKRR
jgi:hypothetical protein